MTFWGYNNEEEARKYWNLDDGKRWNEKRHRDGGEEYVLTFVIIGENKIGF